MKPIDEAHDMAEILREHGFVTPRAYARRLTREGIGPFELQARLDTAPRGWGSLEYTHGFRRST
jgi:hypothetical protein